MSNKYRYLVFFDDGYTQYVHHANIRLVCETSAKVWDDVDPESRQFIKDYLTRYPERPMVKVQLHEIVKTEWNGRWWVARVQDIDGSLVKMHFDADDRTEWIYRGSTRLGPLYLEITAAKNRQTGRNRHASYLKRQAQYVEYTQNVDDNDNNSDDDVQIVEPTGSQTQAAQGGQGQVRSVARKSTANRAQPVLEGGDGGDIVYHRVGPIDASIKPKHFVLQNHPGQIVKVDMSSFPKPKQFVNHACGNHCVAWTGYTDVHSKEIPGLQRPLKFGFQRLFYTKKSKPFVAYIGPCGRRLRNMDEMVKYLFKTRSELACDFFDFDPWVSCVNQYKLHSVKTSIKDLSYGKENISIECVNYVDTTYPDFVYYQTERRAMENVNLNLDPEFLSGCDCTDNCQDRSKCACWQLTINGAKGVPGSDFDENSIGYQYRRLPERVVSGIYECNSQCKCSKTCMNRVVQFPISVKLQLYKTLMKGWGMRCLHDIPQGSFICIYAGNLLTEQAANEGGKTYGDEYLAELDFIEVLENLKDDYESDVTVLSDDEPQITENEDKKNRGKLKLTFIFQTTY
ncbi:histone-lysine N-methyltransferase SETDB1-like [Nilaparvata lugens]|uniref:histone-lysine N-methyltransferase SETDB1-like n=1 Tax=Nilaparvata lugens TaxID=108931 RepID=UPI00193EB826|nr:histone-lysine N-methyltransferase SETDB1-like [Nilaparvata lugens]